MNFEMSTTDETKWISVGPCQVHRVFGSNPQAANLYIQFFEKPAAEITAGDVPARAALLCPFVASQPNWFDWFFEGASEQRFSELSIAISSTAETYTAVVDAGLDLTIEVEGDFLVKSTTTLVGDMTTGVASRQIWASSATNTKKLVKLDIKNNSGATAYPVIRASDSILAGDTTVQILRPIANGATVRLLMGNFIPYRKDGSGTEHKGCTVHFFATGAYSASAIATTSFNVQAVYE